MTRRPTLSVVVFGSVWLAGALIAQAGCAVLRPRPDLTQFYVLESESGPETGAPDGSASPGIRVGPGRIAGYLDVSPIAVRDGTNRVRYLDLYQWAEPLSKALDRMVGRNLARTLGQARVFLYPDVVTAPSYYELRYEVSRFEGTLDGPVTLDVAWRVIERPSGSLVSGTRSVYQVPVADGRTDVSAYVERMSSAVRRWADDVGAAVRPSRVPSRGGERPRGDGGQT